MGRTPLADARPQKSHVRGEALWLYLQQVWNEVEESEFSLSSYHKDPRAKFHRAKVVFNEIRNFPLLSSK